MTRPIAVLISDLHLTPATLEHAGGALEHALLDAQRLRVPTIVCGDTFDSKSIIRAECLHRLYTALARCARTDTYFLVGNHDRWHEKSEKHWLHILNGFPKVHVVDEYQLVDLSQGPHQVKAKLISYQHDPEIFKKYASHTPGPYDRHLTLTICHQGIRGADMGHYVLDKSSIDPTTFKGGRVISGHYHKRQNLPGTNISYLGNPHTLGFGEAPHGPKGYHTLYSDGTLELVPLNLPKHVVVERTPESVLDLIEGLGKYDMLMVKVTGTEEELRLLNKQEIGMKHLGHSNFRLDLITAGVKQQTEEVVQELTEGEVLDKLIEDLDGTDDYKTDLKDTWRGLIDENPKG